MNSYAHPTKQMTLQEMLRRFRTEEDCKQFLASRRWPDGVTCPRCGSKAYTLKARPFHYLCKSGKESVDKQTGLVSVCHKRNGYRFSVITRTVFENTNYPLREWFRVINLMMHAKKGMSAHQIHRMLGTGSYETAWYMCQRVRAAMRDDTFPKLMGVVEVDEAYIGGKNANRHWDKKTQYKAGGQASGKIPVIGAIARKGNVVCQVIEATDTDTLTGFVRKVTSKDVRLVATDEHKGYEAIEVYGLPHAVIKHSNDEYVRGEVHTNTIESFWSLIKRGIMGSYHNVSKKYLPLYLAEFQFRYNNRKNPDIFDAIIGRC